jgi:hypothetical protein
LSIAIFFFLGILMHFSIELSKLKDQNKTLTQELAISNNLIKQVQRRAVHLGESSTFNEG